MEEPELPRDALDRADLWGSFLFFCETFFPLVTGREFIISCPQGRESHHITISRALTKVSRGELTNLLINIQPGSGKSVILSMWVAWMMSRYPDSNFLYIAFSHDLASKHTAFIKRVMENAVYQSTFGIRIKSDSKAKDHDHSERVYCSLSVMTVCNLMNTKLTHCNAPIVTRTGRTKMASRPPLS